jgi:FtsZ-binding cell division protein ZapB
MAAKAKRSPRKKPPRRTLVTPRLRKEAVPAKAAPRINESKNMAEKKAPSADAGGNVEQIRDILFGGQMRDYERRFQELNQRIEADLAQMRADADKRFSTLEKRLDEQLDKLSKAQRQEVGDRNKAVDDLESRTMQAARSQRGELNASIENLSHELSASGERLRTLLGELESALKDHATRAGQSLGATREELRGEKVGREDLAALFTEVAMRLQGQFDLPTK